MHWGIRSQLQCLWWQLGQLCVSQGERDACCAWALKSEMAHRYTTLSVRRALNITRHRASTSTRWYFAFGLYCCSNAIRAPIANPHNSAQMAPLPFPKLNPGPCSSVGMRPRRGTQTRWKNPQEENIFGYVGIVGRNVIYHFGEAKKETGIWNLK